MGPVVNIFNCYIIYRMESGLRNEHYDDCYFSIDSGYLESLYVFVEGNGLKDRCLNGFNIGETGFGTGLNLLVLEDFLESNCGDGCVITFTSIEKYPLETNVVKKTLGLLKEVSEESLKRHIKLYEDMFTHIKNGWNSFSFKRDWGELKINLYIGDIMGSFDNYPVINNCWFLDGHSPDKNPEMWNMGVFNGVALNSKKGTTFATFTAAGVVKRGLRESGLTVKRKKGFGQKRHMISGYL